MESQEYLNPEIETMEPKQLIELQEAKLGKQLDYLFARSLFYQEKFRTAVIRREHFRAIGDLSHFPFTTKEELRESQVACPPLGRHIAADFEDVIRVHTSTGTTGQPSYVGLTRRDAQIWTKIAARCFYTQGIRRSDVFVHAMGLTLFVGGLPSKDAVESIGATFVPIGTGASEKALLAIQALKANVLQCTPSYAMYFAEFVRREAGLEPSELGLKKIVSGAEPGAGIPSVRAKIEKEWGARVTEGLGNADMAAILFAECREQSGMHFNAQEYVFPEIVDPDSGDVLPVEKGATGELVYTSLDRECVPLLRFRTKDRVTVLDTNCKCGRMSFKLRCIGRLDDMLIVLGVNVFPSAIKDVISSFYPRTTGEVQILLDEPGPKVNPPMKIVAESGEISGDLEVLRNSIQSKIKAVLSVPSAVELVPPRTLPRFEMKGKLVKKLYEHKTD